MSVNLGTVTPTHYVVLDNGSMELDMIQKVAYALSHMYFNWTGTVKIPAPWSKIILRMMYLVSPTKWKKGSGPKLFHISVISYSNHL